MIISKPMTIDDLISCLQAVQTLYGNISVTIANHDGREASDYYRPRDFNGSLTLDVKQLYGDSDGWSRSDIDPMGHSSSVLVIE